MKDRHPMRLRLVTLLLLLIGTLAPQFAQAQAFIGEVRWVAFNFAPRNWALCNGQLLPINQNQALFSLLGTTFGGNGQTNFSLPDLRGRAPMHVGGGYLLGQRGGTESHVVTLAELPSHSHALMADPREATAASPAGKVPAKTSDGTSAYGSLASTTMKSGSVSSAGAGQAHENMKPFIALNCIIALQGIFPSPN